MSSREIVPYEGVALTAIYGHSDRWLITAEVGLTKMSEVAIAQVVVRYFTYLVNQ